MDSLLLCTALLSWIILSLIGIRYDANKNEKFLTVNVSDGLKGICALEIMLGHIGIATGSMVLYPNRKAGILFVAVFFFLSGYGLSYGVGHKKNYLKHFLRKHIIGIWIPVILIHIIFVILMALCTGQYTPFLSFWSFIKSVNWYVWEIVCLYIIFAVLYRKGYCNKSTWVLAVLITAFVISAFMGRIDDPWYGSTYGFLIGILYYQYENKINYMIRKHYWQYMIMIGMLCVSSIGLFWIFSENSFLGNVICRNVASSAFVMLLIIILNRFMLGNKLILFLGKFSYEIFLVHPYVISLMQPLNNISKALFAWLVCIITIVIAFVVHAVNQKITGVVYKLLN